MNETTLDAGYRQSGVLLQHHGRTFWLASRLLAPWARRHVAVLYGFARHVDDLVDDPQPGLDTIQIAQQLDSIERDLHIGYERGASDHPLLAALLMTMRNLGLGLEPFDRFLTSMRLDLVRTEYVDEADLAVYTDGSAAAIADMMLPLLTTERSPAVIAAAHQLGIAFQHTNFVRDIVEDVGRGRCYMPADALERAGLNWSEWAANPVVTAPFTALIAERIEVCRQHYRRSQPGIDVLTGRAGMCIRAARAMYAGILDEIERRDYDVIGCRVSVEPTRKLQLGLRSLWE